MRISACFRIEDHLGYAMPVPQIDEDDRSMITSICHPSEQDDLRVDIGQPEGSTIVRSSELVDEACHVYAPLLPGEGRLLARQSLILNPA